MSDPPDNHEEPAHPESQPPVDHAGGDRARRDSEPPDVEHRKRRRLEGVIPDLIKRAVEMGFEKAIEAPESLKQRMHDMKLPKEAVQYILSQVDDTKNGMFRVFAKEVRDFLEHTNLAGEMQKMLTTVQFEVNTTIRFRPNDGKSAEPSEEGDEDKSGRPEVKVDVFAKRADGKNKKKLSKEE